MNTKYRRTLPTVKQLIYFNSLVKHEHFGRAAAACFVSQPAFSAAIKELESLLGVSLVDRTNKQVIVTDLGREVAIQAHLVLNELNSLVDLAEGSGSPLTGRLKLGIIPTIAPFVLPQLLPELKHNYPSLNVEIIEEQTTLLHQRLTSGELDLILLALPFTLKGVEIMTLFDDPFFLAFKEDSVFVNSKKPVSSTLREKSLLLLEDGHCLREHVLNICKIRDENKLAPINPSSLLTLTQLVDQDIGVTFLPEMSLTPQLLSSTNIKTRSAGPNMSRQIALCWRKGSTYGEEFGLLGELITRSAKKSKPLSP